MSPERPVRTFLELPLSRREALALLRALDRATHSLVRNSPTQERCLADREAHVFNHVRDRLLDAVARRDMARSA